MRIFKNREFHRWALSEGVLDAVLMRSIDELGHGLFDADLGGRLYKKRIPLGKGKRSGARAIIIYRRNESAFFIYGFAKHARANVSIAELRALKSYAKVLLNLTNKELNQAVIKRALIEIENESPNQEANNG